MTTTAPSSSAPHSPWLALLHRYRAILAAAWAARHELAGPRHLADEAAFLPAALSLQATPVHPAPRRAAWTIMALFVIALLWACFGKVDIVAVAQGRIIVSDRSKVIQPLETAVVRAIHVKDGDHVQEGQLLVELDATAPEADAHRVAQERAAAVSEVLRSQALLEALGGGRLPRWPGHADLPRADDALAQSQLRAEWADITARLAKLDAEAHRRRTEISTVEQQIAKLQATLPIVRQRAADFEALTAQGFVSSHAGQDRTRERIELERDLETQLARRAEAQAALAESEQTRGAYRAETERTLRERLAQAELRRQQLGSEAEKAALRSRLTRLSAPVSGTVQQLAVHTAGGVATEAQALMVIVPDHAEVTAEVIVENKDVGFVRAEQEVTVKLETFPFTRYGTVPATVRSMAADAVADEKRGAIFPATLVLTQTAIDVDGKQVRLAPGMNVTAEIRTGGRTVIEYLTGPLLLRANEGLRER
ncbi:HlyD family type I secretion periplasmic adaptor subunit [Caldimonas sp. KR1-144]|uniref:HlyD family type I secretion periplasmic adaptor subunit n=1 Tax=Caldimonas sp. KR1-144 TaxID=3400911 RepID=UPI003C11ACD6